MAETNPAQSAENDALVAVAENIAYEHAATVDAEFGCCHDADALRAGGRAPEDEDDEFEPIPDGCLGKRVLERHLVAIRAATHPIPPEECGDYRSPCNHDPAHVIPPAERTNDG